MLGGNTIGAGKYWTPGKTARLACVLAAFLGVAAYAHSQRRIGVVCGDSMSPTLQNGTLYALDTAYYRSHTPQRGEVVVFKRNGVTCIKRVAAAGGDTVFVVKSRDQEGDEVVMDWQLPLVRRIIKNPHWT